MARYSDTQVGAIGESLFCVQAIVTSDGRVETYRPTADDDHRDVAVVLRGGFATAYIQVKTSTGPDREGRILARARYPNDRVLEHPGFVYALILATGTAIDGLWLIPSRDFNALAFREASGPTHVQLVLEAYVDRPDRWTPFKLPPAELGARLVAILDELAGAPAYPPELTSRFT